MISEAGSLSLDTGIHPSLTPAGHSFLHSTVALQGGNHQQSYRDVCHEPHQHLRHLISTLSFCEDAESREYGWWGGSALLGKVDLGTVGPPAPLLDPVALAQ